MDGRLVGDSRKGLRINKAYNEGLPEWLNITAFSDSFVHLYNSFDPRASHRTSPALFRVADMRLYPRALTEAELQKVHVESRWPVGTEWPPKGGLIRQVLQIDDCRIFVRLWARGRYSSPDSIHACVFVCMYVRVYVRSAPPSLPPPLLPSFSQCAQEADTDFADSIFTDAANRDCLWYAKNVRKTPYICSSVEAKTLCPVTCRGRVTYHRLASLHMNMLMARGNLLAWHLHL